MPDGNRGDTVIADSRFVTTEHPKLKFNFTVEFDFRDGIEPVGAYDMAMMTLPVKSFTRPAVSFNMVDLNFYNYRTKTATKTDFGTVTILMYDDARGEARAIHDLCLKTYSGIANLASNDKTLIDSLQDAPFGSVSSSVTEIREKMGLIRTIKLNHHFVMNGRAECDTYTLFNPKMVSGDLGDLSMSESDVTTVAITFAYDGYNTTNGRAEVNELENIR